MKSQSSQLLVKHLVIMSLNLFPKDFKINIDVELVKLM